MRLHAFAAALMLSSASAVLLPPMAQAAIYQPDQDTLDQIQRVTQSLDRSARNIERIGPDTNERRIESIERALDRDSKRLAGLDTSIPEVAALITRIDQMRAQMADAQASAGAAAGNREAQREQLGSWQAAGRTSEDDAFIRTASYLAGEVKFMDFQHNHLMREDGIAEQYVRFATTYPDTQARIDQILADYAGMDPRDVREFSGPSLAMLVQEGGPDFQEANDRLSAFGQPALNRARSLLSDAESVAQAALSSGRPGDLIENRTVEGALNYLDGVSRVYRARPDAERSVLAAYDQLQDRANANLRAALSEALSQVIAENPPVSNAFVGGDRASIERMVRERWAQAYPNDEILQVRISQRDWVRRREPGWRDGLLIMFDYSIVTPWVVVAERDGMASQWGMVAEKDHTQGDQISISFGRLRTDDLDPRFTVLRSNLD